MTLTKLPFSITSKKSTIFAYTVIPFPLLLKNYSMNFLFYFVKQLVNWYTKYKEKIIQHIRVKYENRGNFLNLPPFTKTHNFLREKAIRRLLKEFYLTKCFWDLMNCLNNLKNFLLNSNYNTKVCISKFSHGLLHLTFVH